MNKKVVWKKKTVGLGGAIAIGGLMMIVGVVIGINWHNWFNSLYFGSPNYTLNWTALDEVYSKLANTYNGEIDTKVVIDGAKQGLVESLGDVYTTYMNSKKSAEFYDDLHGKVGSGIGVEMGLRDGYVRVLRTLPDNPARKAGILAGDIFYKVNGEEVWDWSSDEIAQKVRGESGTEVTVTIIRDGEEKEFTMKRETINNVSAYVEYDGKTAIVVLTRFDDDTGKKVQKFASEFAAKGINKVILDLRGNGGGYVSAAQDLLSLWLDNQKVFEQKSRHFGDDYSNSGSGKAILKDMKTIVLVNGSTASASEIVAGALQDYKKATIVGEKTYGKGVVQSLYNLSDGATLKVTTAEWYTPEGRSINKTGISPDVEVERSFEDINAMRDPQLDKAKAL